MTPKINGREEKLRKNIDKIMKDLHSLSRELDETGEDIEETGEDVEEIKEDIEEIKEDIGIIEKSISKGKKFMNKVIPDKFSYKDIAQQIVGATILAAPFAVTEEVWNLSKNLTSGHVIAIVLITILLDVLLFYYTKYQIIENKKLWMFPKRIFSLIIITYVTSAVVLSVFGVIGGVVQETGWIIRLIVMVGLFANIGASTADLIR